MENSDIQQMFKELRVFDISYQPIFQNETTELSKQLYSIYACILLEDCDKFKLKKSTKYLAKNYFDRFIRVRKLTEQIANPDYLNSLKSASILKAVEFNEKNQILEKQICNLLLTETQSLKVEQFGSIRQQLLKTLNEELEVTTPYHYVEILKNIIPNFKKKILLVQYLIDLCLTFENFADLTAQERFFGCLLQSFEGEKNEQTKKEIEQLTEKYDKAKELAAQLKQIYQEITQTQ